MWPLILDEERSHPLFPALLKDFTLIRRRHLHRHIRFESAGKERSVFGQDCFTHCYAENLSAGKFQIGIFHGTTGGWLTDDERSVIKVYRARDRFSRSGRITVRQDDRQTLIGRIAIRGEGPFLSDGCLAQAKERFPFRTKI